MNRLQKIFFTYGAVLMCATLLSPQQALAYNVFERTALTVHSTVDGFVRIVLPDKLMCSWFGLLCFEEMSTRKAEDTEGQDASSTNAEEVVILATGEWLPYSSETAENHGIFTEIVTAVLEEADIPYEYRFYPWKRAEAQLAAGEVFAIFPYYINEERSAKFNFSDRVIFSIARFFYLKENFPNGLQYNELIDLRQYRIGGVLGYWYEPAFREAGLNVEYVASDEQSIEQLYRGRVDIVPNDELVGHAVIQKLYPDDVDAFGTSQKPMTQDGLQLMVSRDYPNSGEILRSFNEALQRLQERGAINAILQKYGVDQSGIE